MVVPLIQKVTAVLWPSFLCSGVETVLFFTFFDPVFLLSDYEISRLGGYTIGFFMFWALTALSGAGTLYYLTHPKHEQLERTIDP